MAAGAFTTETVVLAALALVVPLIMIMLAALKLQAFLVLVALEHQGKDLLVALVQEMLFALAVAAALVRQAIQMVEAKAVMARRPLFLVLL